MKVEQAEQEFSPITITLETREEAVALWHLGNHVSCQSIDDYFDNEIKTWLPSENKVPTQEYALVVRHALWDALDDILDPDT